MPNSKWLAFTQLVTEASDRTKLRWRKAEPAVFAGEITVLLNRSGLKSYPETLNAVIAILKLYAKNSNNFYVEEERNKPAASLGKLLWKRFQGLTQSEDNANSLLKVWLKASPEDFQNIHLTRILSYNNAHSNPERIPLNSLFELAANWSHNTERKITAIATEFYNNSLEENN